MPRIHINRFSILSLCLCLWAVQVTSVAGADPATRPSQDRRVERALIISIDGLRPDVMLRANTPTLRALMKAGSFSMWARTTAMSVTLPSHTSMLTGVTPERHGVNWNGDLLPEEQRYPLVPTLFERARTAGYSTALVAGKTKFATLARPGTIDFVDIRSAEDTVIADAATNLIRQHQPQVMMVHLASVDTAGHGEGWGSKAQISRIEIADAAVASILSSLDQHGLREKTLIVVSTDHGGAGRNHGADDPRSRHIPWIVAGPGVRQEYDLTNHRDLIINTEDTFATVCFMLGIPLEASLDGKNIHQILVQDELLQSGD